MNSLFSIENAWLALFGEKVVEKNMKEVHSAAKRRTLITFYVLIQI